VNGTQILIARTAPPSAFNFYPTEEAAKADLPRANRDESGKYSVMTWAEFENAQRAFYLGDAPEEITQEKFQDAFEVLPPLKYHGGAGFESFLMSEFHSIPYTHQYIRVTKDGKDRYFSKLVDATDRQTWMTAEVWK
jgi:hypothetical protein